MREALLTPAAILAQSILKSVEGHHPELTEEIVASAFESAYKAILIADKRFDEEYARNLKATGGRYPK